MDIESEDSRGLNDEYDFNDGFIVNDDELKSKKTKKPKKKTSSDEEEEYSTLKRKFDKKVVIEDEDLLKAIHSSKLTEIESKLLEGEVKFLNNL